jgi:alpha-N-arabinofuranosidase
MDGDWQTCHLDAHDYGKKALEAAKIMKWVDPKIELAVCGSATSRQATYPEWDRIVLEHAWEKVDYLSLHRYYENLGNELDFLASFHEMDNFIKMVASTADYVKTLKRSKKTMMLSFDEWNIWYQAKSKMNNWEFAPHILEDNYSLLDAIVFGGLLCTLINNSDRVRIACLAQMVNVIAPIFTEKGGKAIRQTIFYPFALAAKYCTGTALKVLAKIPKLESAAYGDVPSLASAATWDGERGEIALMCVNIADTPQNLQLDLRSFGTVHWVEHLIIEGELSAVNTFDEPDRVKPSAHKVPPEGMSEPQAVLGPKSFHLMRFKV